MAAEEGISAFIIFTDEELAELAKLDEITEKAMLGIKGIGEKKVQRFA
ncbi:MAG: HRDC domain-containing protein, partial [Phaeodactylibacter sp.]|nr:HRDC domain-containing protein [Phaeodactylibacter sp.]